MKNKNSIAKLPSPQDRPDADVVIFDGECQFCRGQVNNLLRFDGGKRLSFISLHDPFVRDHFPDLTHDQLMEQMYVIPHVDDGYSEERYGGANAVRYLTRRLPRLWLLAPVLHLPFSLPIWQRLYQWIARRRYQLAKRNNTLCDENGSCQVHFKK